MAVTLGCFLANLLGSTLVDVVFGTAATLVACLLTYAVRKMRVGGLAIPAAVPPIVSNAVIVGALELTFFLPGVTGTAALAAWNARGHRRGGQLRHPGRSPGEADGEQRRPAPPVLRMSRFF